MLERHARDLLTIPGVVGVAAGERAGAPYIQALVEADSPETRDRIPRSIESFRVEVVVSGELRALGREGPGDAP